MHEKDVVNLLLQWKDEIGNFTGSYERAISELAELKRYIEKQKISFFEQYRPLLIMVFATLLIILLDKTVIWNTIDLGTIKIMKSGF